MQNLLLSLFFKSQYVRRGQCAGTGQCCNAIGMEFPGWILKRPRFLGVFRKWHEWRYRFVFEGVQGKMLVYSCQDLTPDKRCGIQWMKPKLCRDFPQTPLYGITKLHKGCGFYFEKRQGADFGKVLRGVRTGHEISSRTKF